MTSPNVTVRLRLTAAQQCPPAGELLLGGRAQSYYLVSWRARTEGERKRLAGGCERFLERARLALRLGCGVAGSQGGPKPLLDSRE